MQRPEPLPKPTAYRPEFAEEARKWALMRATDEGLARHFDIPLATLHEWLASVPEFAEVVGYGRKQGDADVVDRFRQIAMGCFPEVVTRRVGAEEEIPDVHSVPSAQQGCPELLAGEPPARRVAPEGRDRGRAQP